MLTLGQKPNEFWTGRSTFKVLANAEVIDSDKSYKVNQGVITLCTHCSELNTIPITDVFVPYQYHIEVGKHEVDHPKVSVILWRDRKNRTLEFQLSKSPCDLMTSKFAKFSLAINLIEVPRDVPCFVLLYVPKRETGSHFCKTRCKTKWNFTLCPSLKMMTCSRHTEYAKQDDASGPNSIQCSLQVRVQEVHHGTESIDGSVKQRHNSLKQRSRSSGPCGRCLRQCYVNSSTWDRQPCLNCLEVVITGRTVRWLISWKELYLMSTNSMDACMAWNRNSKKLPNQSRNLGRLSHGGYHFRNYVGSVIAVMTMQNVPVGKLALLKFTRNG